MELIAENNDEIQRATKASVEYERRMQHLISSNSQVRIKDIQKYSKRTAKDLKGNKAYLRAYESGRWNRIAEEDDKRDLDKLTRK